jgi:hypothetical protein
MTVMRVITVKMVLLLLLLMKRIAMWRAILVVMLTIVAVLFWRTWTTMMYSVNYFLVILDLKTQQLKCKILSVFLLFFIRNILAVEKIVVEQFMNSRGRLLLLDSL